MTKLEDLQYKFNKNIMLRNVGKTTLAYNPETGDMYELNEVGAEIYQLLKEEYDINEILAKMCNNYNTTKDVIYEDIYVLLKRMIELGIIIEL